MLTALPATDHAVGQAYSQFPEAGKTKNEHIRVLLTPLQQCFDRAEMAEDSLRDVFILSVDVAGESIGEMLA